MSTLSRKYQALENAEILARRGYPNSVNGDLSEARYDALKNGVPLACAVEERIQRIYETEGIGVAIRREAGHAIQSFVTGNRWMMESSLDSAKELASGKNDWSKYGVAVLEQVLEGLMYLREPGITMQVVKLRAQNLFD